jgi:hypothetical protein
MRRIFSTAGRGAVVAVVAGLALGGAVHADPGPKVTGGYSYIVFEGREPRSVSVEAQGSDPVRGRWVFERGRLSGPVTCLNVQGDEAFMFGPGTVGGRGAFLWVRDGGLPGGAGDEAITWIQDLPGDELPPDVEPQTLEEMEGWCLNAGDGYPGPGPAPLVTGNLTIHQ